MTRKNRKLSITLLCLFLIAAVILISTGISIVRFGNLDEKRPVDAAIVLGAASYNGEILPVFRERINHGLWLFENGYVDFLIFTGGYPQGSTMSESAAARRYAMDRGVPEEAIFIEEVSTITEENIAEAKKIMDENGFQTAIIVSDPLHMKRAMTMAKDYGITAFSSPTPTTMYQSAKTRFAFLVREEILNIGYGITRLFK